MDDDGCIDCDELKEIYPTQWRIAREGNLDYYEGMRNTAKQLTSPDSDGMDKKRLYQAIRKLEAENYTLRKRLQEMEDKLLNLQGK